MLGNVKRFFLPISGAALAAALVVSGCSDSHGPSGYQPGYHVGSTGALLSQAGSCDDLLSRLQADGLAKVELQAQQMAEGYAYGYWGWQTAVDAGVDLGGGEPPVPDDYSDTNVQVEGVDEGDIVETDGTHIYLLSGNDLLILASWPPDQTALEGQVAIEGAPREMFVANGEAVVFSTTGDPRVGAGDQCAVPYADFGPYYPCYAGGFTKITQLDLTGATPTVERELYVEGDYRSSRRHDRQVRVVVNQWGGFYDLDLPDPWPYLNPPQPGPADAAPADAAPRPVDGSPGAADAGIVGTVTPSTSALTEPTEEEWLRRIYRWRDAAMAAVRETTLDDWVPVLLERTADGVTTTEPPDCGHFFVPRPGSAGYGSMQIVGIDTGAPAQAPTRTAIWGQAGQVYANADTMVIAQQDTTTEYRAFMDGQDEPYGDATVLHRFALDATTGDTVYEASGVVPGGVNDQFSMDEKDGVIRVATTQTTWVPWWSMDAGEWQPPTTTSQVLTVGRADDSATLEVLGSTGPLVENERIYATRYIGDIAYVVTFRQVDPLFAVDLSDPTAPRLLGELEIPGFSNYMHPLDEGHLLTIGQDADASGRVQGLSLQIFDVTDPTAPQLLHKHVFADGYGYSEANWNHKAFTYFPSRGLLAFPYVSWGADWSTYQSSLEVLSVDVASGFTELGSVDHSDLVAGVCDPVVDYYCAGYGLEIRRGVFIEDYVYSISYGGVRVHAVSDLTTPLATVVLPQ